MSNLRNVQVTAEREEVARGIRILLRSPLVTERSDPDSFELIRRRSGSIAQWFDYTCGWTLLAEPRLGYFRLVKVAAGEGRDASRPARRLRSGRTPFDRRRYTLLCVVAAELVPTPVTTIGLLADRVTLACAADPALASFDTSVRAQRMAFVDVLHLLTSLGVLSSIDGAADSYVDTTQAKVLFEVDTALLVRLLAAPTGPSHLDVPPEQIGPRFDQLVQDLLTEHRYGDQESDDGHATEVQRNLWLRHSVLRRLFDDPVVYLEDLTRPQRDYLASPTGRRILRQAAEQAGFVLEERAEGYLLVDSEAIATDSRFPDGSSTAKTAALVMLDWLSARPDGATDAELTAAAEHVLGEAAGWAKTYRSEGGARRLAEDACAVLCDFDLACRRGNHYVVRPAAARYASASVTVTRDEVDHEGGLW